MKKCKKADCLWGELEFSCSCNKSLSLSADSSENNGYSVLSNCDNGLCGLIVGKTYDHGQASSLQFGMVSSELRFHIFEKAS